MSGWVCAAVERLIECREVPLHHLDAILDGRQPIVGRVAGDAARTAAAHAAAHNNRSVGDRGGASCWHGDGRCWRSQR